MTSRQAAKVRKTILDGDYQRASGMLQMFTSNEEWESFGQRFACFLDTADAEKDREELDRIAAVLAIRIVLQDFSE